MKINKKLFLGGSILAIIPFTSFAHQDLAKPMEVAQSTSVAPATTEDLQAFDAVVERQVVQDHMNPNQDRVDNRGREHIEEQDHRGKKIEDLATEMNRNRGSENSGRGNAKDRLTAKEGRLERTDADSRAFRENVSGKRSGKSDGPGRGENSGSNQGHGGSGTSGGGISGSSH